MSGNDKKPPAKSPQAGESNGEVTPVETSSDDTGKSTPVASSAAAKNSSRKANKPKRRRRQRSELELRSKIELLSAEIEEEWDVMEDLHEENEKQYQMFVLRGRSGSKRKASS